MILSKNDIRRAVEAEEIGFTPGLEETQWGEASIDLRLGFQFTKFRDAAGLTVSVADGLKTIGRLGLWATKTLKESDEFGTREERWSRLSEQFFRVDKWSLCRG
jgi:deoxycytidine triphosphate deaminase